MGESVASPSSRRAVETVAALACALGCVAGSASATVCPNPPIPAVSDVCGATAGSASLLLRGAIVVNGDVLENGHLLVDATGSIECAACDCSGSPSFPSATRIDCPDGVVLPGRIDANEFLNFAQNLPGDWGEERFEHRHDWRLGQNGHGTIGAASGATTNQQRWGELRQLFGGTTAMRGSTSVAGLVRNLDTTVAATEGLTSAPWSDDNFPLGDSSGARLDGSCAYPALPTAPVGAPYWLNVAEGIDATARNEFACLSGASGGVDVVDGAMVVDAIALAAADVATLGAGGSTVVWSPRSHLALYGRTSPVTQLHRRGVPLALGTDWIVTGSMSMSRELACADRYNRRYLAGRLSDRELVDSSARNAAVAGAMDDEIGVLAAGRLADVVVFGRGGRAPYRAAIEADFERLALVLRAGRPLAGEDDLLAAWPVAGCADAPVTFCGRSLRVCLAGELGVSYATLAAANLTSYPDHFCDTPVNEPPCVPARPLVSGGFPANDGVPTADDFDGDGVANVSDLCPVIFDPPVVSPLAQPDADSDGAGDACDFCPTSGSPTGCGESSATDLAIALALPPALVAGHPFAVTLTVGNSGGSAGTARAVLPSLLDLDDVSWTCSGTGGGSCPAAGTVALDAGVALPPGGGAVFSVTATHPGPPTAPGERFVFVTSAIPPEAQGETDSLDNYDAKAVPVLPAEIFVDGFEAGNTGLWSAVVP